MIPRKKIHRFKSKIIGIKQLNPTVKHITISLPEEFDFYPGQFVSFIFDNNGTEIRRPYSIASNPRKGSLDIVIKIVANGLITPTINKMKVGDELTVLGPMGTFTIKDKAKPIIFISTGTGIGPFRSMILDLLENGCKNNITLLTGYRNEEDVLYDNEFNDLMDKNKNFFYHKILSQDENFSKKGWVQKLVEQNLNPNNHYYICGLKDMVNSVRELLEKNNIPQDNIFFEKYD